MGLPHLAKAPYLKADNVDDGDVVTIVKAPWIVKKEDARGPYKRDRAYIGISLKDGEAHTWGLNVTTYERLLEAFGDDADQWVGQKVKIRKEMQTIRGELHPVLFGSAVRQEKLAPAEKPME